MSKQTAEKIFMVEPDDFGYNAETAVNNYFQHKDDLPAEEIQRRAMEEFNAMQDMLGKQKIAIIMLRTSGGDKALPDAVFPNNCVSFHGEEGIVFYSMFALNRQLERRGIQHIVTNIEDFKDLPYLPLGDFEIFNEYLEGTGSMVLDRDNKIAYAALSERTNKRVLGMFCKLMEYTPLTFRAYQTVGKKRLPIYHTNVMMSVAEQYAVICLSSIRTSAKRQEVVDSLKKTGKEIIEITEEQVNCFAGNMLQLRNSDGKLFMVMSKTAHDSLREDQLEAIKKYNDLIVPDVPTIERYGGGSVRCMICEIF